MSKVHLNHFYTVIDSAAYRDIEQSAFLRGEFAATELRTTVRKDLTYTGLYFYGANTYFEFFDASGSALGDQFRGNGIAFGVDESGMLQTIQKKLSPDFILDEELITRQYADGQVPWFHSTKLKNLPLDADLSVWFMEYHPYFLEEWNPRPEIHQLGIKRSQILQRYVSILKDVPPSPLFEDVVGLTMAFNEPTRKKITELAVRLGFRELVSYGTTTLKGTDLEIYLIPPTNDREGIREVSMRVKGKPRGGTEFHFGRRSTLKFHDNRFATWSFQ